MQTYPLPEYLLGCPQMWALNLPEMKVASRLLYLAIGRTGLPSTCPNFSQPVNATGLQSIPRQRVPALNFSLWDKRPPAARLKAAAWQGDRVSQLPALRNVSTIIGLYCAKIQVHQLNHPKRELSVFGLKEAFRHF